MSSKTRILLVDGDLDFMKTTQPELEKNGFEILCAHSAREGWEMAVYEQPDLIVMELVLERPDSGFVLARALKGDPRFKYIPILLLTHRPSDNGQPFDFEKDGYWIKADDFAEKPVPVTELVARIDKLLEDKQL